MPLIGDGTRHKKRARVEPNGYVKQRSGLLWDKPQAWLLIRRSSIETIRRGRCVKLSGWENEEDRNRRGRATGLQEGDAKGVVQITISKALLAAPEFPVG